MPMQQPYQAGPEIAQQQEQAKSVVSGQNPIVDALKTIQMYVTAQKQQGNDGPGLAFMQFLESLGGGMNQQPQEQEQAFNPFEAPEEQTQGSRPMLGPQSGMRGEMQGKAKVMSM